MAGKVLNANSLYEGLATDQKSPATTELNLSSWAVISGMYFSLLAFSNALLKKYIPPAYAASAAEPGTSSPDRAATSPMRFTRVPTPHPAAGTAAESAVRSIAV